MSDRDKLLNAVINRDYTTIKDIFNELSKDQNSGLMQFFREKNAVIKKPYTEIEVNKLFNYKLFMYAVYYQDISFLQELLFIDNFTDIFGNSHIPQIICLQETNILEFLLENIDSNHLPIEKLFDYVIIFDTKPEIANILLKYGHVPSPENIYDSIYYNIVDIIKIFIDYQLHTQVQSAFDKCVFYNEHINPNNWDKFDDECSCIQLDMLQLLTNNIPLTDNINDVFYHSAQNDLTDMILFCLDNFNTCNINTGFKISCLNNRVDSMKILLKYGADINIIDETDLLFINTNTVKFLIQNKYFFSGEMLSDALIQIIKNDSEIDDIHYMLDIGADLGALLDIDYKERDVLAIMMVQNGNMELIKYIVENYYNKIITDTDTLIRLCIQYQQIEILEYLLSVFELNYDFNSLFYDACINGRSTSAEYLVKKIDHIQFDEELFSKIITNGIGQYIKVLKLLMKYDVPVPKKLSYNELVTALFHNEIIFYIIKKNPDLLNENNFGRHIANKNGYFTINNILEMAVFRNNYELTEYLLDAGMDPRLNGGESFRMANEKMLKLLEKY